MSRPTLEQIVWLTVRAKRSATARKVLLDALLERYGRVFERALERAQNIADERQEPIALYLRASRLPDYEQIIRREVAAGYDPESYPLENIHAISAYDIHAIRRGWAPRGILETGVVLLHPRRSRS